MKILPAILVEDLEEYKKQIECVVLYSDEIFIDIIDWQKTDNKTINANQALSIDANINMNFDLMLDYPSDAIGTLLNDKRVKSIILNFEIKEDIKQLIKKIKEKDVKVGVSLNPENSVEEIKELLEYLNCVQIFTINPGKQGQFFLSRMLEKTSELRDNNFKGEIIIDGGINEKTIEKIIKYPVNILSIGSALSEAENPKESYVKLKNLANI